MATKVKRSLYIGLGGTGMNAILHTKKKFVDTYGEVPPMIGFLGIDTDSNAYKHMLYSDLGEPINLTPNEQFPIRVPDARPIYDVNIDKFSWLPEENLYALDSMMLGAGQVRTNGRFAFTVHYASVLNKVRTILNTITNASIINNDKYELMNTNTEIHMVFSICGGTGCGTFINMAYVLKEAAPACKLTGYAVLPEVFKSMSNSGMSRVAPNAYGAIMDLDYLMGVNMGSKPLKLEYLNSEYTIRTRPFNSMVFIDSKNEHLDSYTHIDELTEMISLALVTSAGELSSAAASVSDNLEKNISAGTMDIKNKKAWAAGMGACEIIFKGSTLSKIYSMKAAKNLIDWMFNSCQDVDSIVNAWIDSAEVNIRENNNNDHVIDYICDKNPRYEFSLTEYANPMPSVQQYISMCMTKDNEILEKITSLTNRVRAEFRKLIIKHINKECGVSTAEKIVQGIQAQINIFMSEMVSEKEELENKLPRLKMSLETAVNDLKGYDGKFFKKRTKLEDYANDVSDITRSIVVCKREIVRRNSAITVFNNISSMLLDATDKVKLLKDSLKSVYRGLTEDLAKLQNSVGRATRTFQIDLATDAVQRITVNPDDIKVDDFVKSLTNPGKIFDFAEFSDEEIKKLLLKYTSRSQNAKHLSNTTIDEVLNQMPNEDFDRCIELAIKKSMPLFRYSYRGYTPNETPRDSFYIGVPDKSSNRLFKDNYFKSKIEGNADADFANIGIKDRIIIYRQVGVLPAYTIDGIQDFKREYEDCNVNCHIDANLLRKMQREDFELMPKKETEDDLLELWVKGFIFGLIRNHEGMYQLQSQEEGQVLDDFWIDLSNYRDEAFTEFKRHKVSVRREFNHVFEEIATNKGAEVMTQEIQKVKAGYFENYSQINMTKEQIKSKGYEPIKELITSELIYVKNQL